jgi:alpha-glucosidase
VVRCTTTSEGLSIDFAAREGSFTPWWTTMAITVHGWAGTGGVTLAGKPVTATTDAAAKTITFEIAAPKRAGSIRVAAR